MPLSDAQRWDERYAQEGLAWLERQPRRLLVKFAHLLPDRGIVLDAAAGVSTTGLFLAERGLHVIAVDISEVALRLARQRAAESSLPFSPAVIDLTDPWLPSEYFDLILNFRFLERKTIPVYRQALKPGGLIFFETFIKTNAELPRPEYYLNPGELRQAFADFETLHWHVQPIIDEDLAEVKVSEQLVSRKPLRQKDGE